MHFSVSGFRYYEVKQYCHKNFYEIHMIHLERMQFTIHTAILHSLNVKLYFCTPHRHPNTQDTDIGTYEHTHTFVLWFASMIHINVLRTHVSQTRRIPHQYYQSHWWHDICRSRSLPARRLWSWAPVWGPGNGASPGGWRHRPWTTRTWAEGQSLRDSSDGPCLQHGGWAGGLHRRPLPGGLENTREQKQLTHWPLEDVFGIVNQLFSNSYQR